MSDIHENIGVKKKIELQTEAIKKIFGHCSCYQIKEDEKGFFASIDGIVTARYPLGFIGKLIFMSAFKELEKLILRSKINFIYIRYFQFSNYFFIRFLENLKNFGVTVVIEIPTYPYDSEFSNTSIARVKNLIDRTFRKKLVNCVDFIVNFGDEKKIWGINCINISNGVQTNISLTDRSCNSEFRFVALANLTYWHGYDRFINGLHKYRSDSKKRIYLDVIGDGPELKKLQKLVLDLNLSSTVTFHGKKSGSNLDLILSKSHIGIDSLGRHRTLNEHNSSLKSKEYMVHGLPVAKSHRDDLIDNCEFYFQIDATDEPVDITSIINWYEGKKFSKEEIHAFAVTNFNWDKQFQYIYDVIYGR